MTEKRTHITRYMYWTGGASGVTLCGRFTFGVRLIPKGACVDTASCKACQRADDALQVRNYRRECKEAGLDPDTMEPLKRKAI